MIIIILSVVTQKSQDRVRGVEALGAYFALSIEAGPSDHGSAHLRSFGNKNRLKKNNYDPNTPSARDVTYLGYVTATTWFNPSAQPLKSRQDPKHLINAFSPEVTQ